MRYVILIILLVSLGICQERVIGEKEVTATVQVRIIIPARTHEGNIEKIKETPDHTVDPQNIKGFQEGTLKDSG